jgi:Putative auto-transporter adhesin, head GIN domain
VRRKNATILLALALITLAVSGCAENERASEDNTENQATSNGEKATLELQGDPGTEFQGYCAVGDQEPEQISGQVPESFTYELKGRPLDCEISSDGDVQVDLNIGENVRSVQRISGGTLNLTYENGGISSFVSSSSGSSVQRPSSSSATTAQESSNVTSESRNVSGFDGVELNGVGNLSIQQTGSEALTVEAEEDVLPKIRTEVENNRLIIGPEPNSSINTTKPINYKLTVKDLKALKVSGSGDVEAEDISTDELAVTISGTGDVEISGRADSQKIDISGSGDYQAEDLESKEAKIDAGGSGSALVNVSDELEAEVSGSGSVEYVGDPTVDQDVSGAGRVGKH